MDKKSRRNALKALAVGAPVVWAKPVVDSVALPAHASLSGCRIPAGCVWIWDDSDLSYDWPGGTGPYKLEEAWNNSSCNGDPAPDPGEHWYVIAPSMGQAEKLFKDLGLITTTNFRITSVQDPKIPEGCYMYYTFNEVPD